MSGASSGILINPTSSSPPPCTAASISCVSLKVHRRNVDVVRSSIATEKVTHPMVAHTTYRSAWPGGHSVSPRARIAGVRRGLGRWPAASRRVMLLLRPSLARVGARGAVVMMHPGNIGLSNSIVLVPSQCVCPSTATGVSLRATQVHSHC